MQPYEIRLGRQVSWQVGVHVCVYCSQIDRYLDRQTCRRNGCYAWIISFFVNCLVVLLHHHHHLPNHNHHNITIIITFISSSSSSKCLSRDTYSSSSSIGTVDQTTAEKEWVLRPYMNTARKKQSLQIDRQINHAIVTMYLSIITIDQS